MGYLLIHTVDPDLAPASPEEQRDAWDLFSSWAGELDAAGAGRHGSRLRPPEDATTVKIRDGELIVTDGPYAETKEQIGGYDVLECDSLGQAVQWAGKHPHARMGSVEVRALADGAPAGPLPGPGAGKTRYMVLACADPAAGPVVSGQMEPSGRWAGATDSRGIRVFASELEPPGAARTVRVRQDRVIVTDGPFAETKEQIAGFDLLDCADLDEAIEIAATHPMARGGILEVRPLWPH
jgi:hypothetical protein